MSNPLIANNKPIKVELTKGEEYYFCTCGRSKSQPFCDGSHKGTNLTPKAFTADETGDAWLCACKHTGNAPFCDGSHKQFTDSQLKYACERLIEELQKDGQPTDQIEGILDTLPESVVAFSPEVSHE